MDTDNTRVFFIHGGFTFKNREDYRNFLKNREISIEENPVASFRQAWSGRFLEEELGDSFQGIKPLMPCADYAQYEEWRTHFERYVPYMTQPFILIGESLGGTFLAKYLSENELPQKALSVYLVCPPFDDTMPEEDLAGGFELGADLSGLEESTEDLYLMFSKDDDVVPVSHADKFKEELTDAEIIIYESKNGHFDISEFPGIVEKINADMQKGV